MTTIRPLAPGDVPAVAALYERVLRSGSDTPPPLLAPTLERYFLTAPGTDPEIPALVCLDKAGTLVGFVGSAVRRMVFDGRPIRLACSGPLVRDPDPRYATVGALLMRRYLAGPQEVTITDGATDLVARMWSGLGGAQSNLASLEWIKPLRPARFALGFGLDKLKLGGLKAAVLPLAGVADAAARRRAVAPDGATSEELSAESLAVHCAEFAGKLRLRPDYDRAVVDWLFAEMAALPSRGALFRRLVRDKGGRAVGWFIGFLAGDGAANVLQVGARPASAGAVLDHLFQWLGGQGAVAVSGRVEPHLFQALGERKVLFKKGAGALIHARDREILAAVAMGDALLTRFDGEWWVPLHLERYEREAPSSAAELRLESAPA